MLIFSNQVNRFPDMSKATLTEDIQFKQADFFRQEHIDLRSIKIFWRKFSRCILIDRFITDEHAACVYAEMVGEIPEKGTIIIYLALYFIIFQIAGVQLVDFFFGQSENFTKFPQDGPGLKCGIGSKQADMVPSISFKNIINDFIAVFPGEIQVEIRRCRAVWIEKSFKIQIQFNRIHVCYLQAVSYY